MVKVFNCPECNGEITVRYSKPGEIVQCKSCKADVIVPADAREIDLRTPSKEERTIKEEKVPLSASSDEIEEWRKGFNWGAFLLAPIWLIAHGKEIFGILLIVIFLPSPIAYAVVFLSEYAWAQLVSGLYILGEFGIAIYVGSKGNTIALENRGRRTFEKIKKREENWAAGGVIVAVFIIIVNLIQLAG